MTPHERIEESEGEEPRIDLALWRRLLRFVRPYRREVILLCTFGVATAGVDTAFPLVTRRLIDDLDARGAAVELRPYALTYLFLMTALSTAVWSFIRYAGKIRTAVSHDIRRAGFENLQRLSFSYFDRRPVGWLMARMTSDCERLSNILAWGVLDLFWGVTLLIGIGLAMFIMNPLLAGAVIVVLPLLAWVSGAFQKRILRSARKVRKLNSRLTASYNESIMGVRTAKVFVRERENLNEFQELSSGMFAASMRNALQSALYLPIVMTLGSLAAGLVLAVGGFEVSAGRISIGTLIAFLAYTRQFFEPIQELAAWLAEMQMAHASAERVLGVVDAVPEIADSPEVLAALDGRTAGAAKGPEEDEEIDEIEFRGVSFAYEADNPVLSDFDLRVRTGETIALVGSTGGGKSTIVNLLCRFYEPTAGEILLDGVDYRRRGLHWLQSRLGIVLQTPHLFRGTIEDNIRYGRLEATHGEVVAAAELAGAHDFVLRLEAGYGTEVGEGGARLSTGEKQLVSFARAILARPEILVMDEATSSIDTETEKRIQRGLRGVLGGRTAFVIAHRLSTIRSADRILVIERGRITEQGTHGELMAARGRYHDLYREQSLREESTELGWDGGLEPGPAMT